MKTKNRILATLAKAAAIPPNPKILATIAKMKKKSAQPSILASLI
jgi:hypothetical protein